MMHPIKIYRLAIVCLTVFWGTASGAAESQDSVAGIVALYWKDAAIAVLFIAAAVLWRLAHKQALRQEELQKETRELQEKREDEHFAAFVEKLKTLDERFQGDVKSFAAETSKRAAGNEKLLRAQEHALKKAMEELIQKSEDIGQMTDAMRAALDSKDEEIRRLKEGHDAAVWAKFVRRFIRVHQYVDDLIAEGAEGAYLPKIKQRLDGALEECGVEPFAPPVGSRYDEQPEGALDESPEEEPCPAASDEFKITAVLQRGYRLHGGGKTITPAKVRIYSASRPRQRGSEADADVARGKPS